VIQDLLAIASDFVSSDDHPTRIQLPGGWKKTSR
jgi:hypothetical protein